MTPVEKKRAMKCKIRNIVKHSSTETEAVNKLLLNGLAATNSQAKRMYWLLKNV